METGLNERVHTLEDRMPSEDMPTGPGDVEGDEVREGLSQGLVRFESCFGDFWDGLGRAGDVEREERKAFTPKVAHCYAGSGKSDHGAV